MKSLRLQFFLSVLIPLVLLGCNPEKQGEKVTKTAMTANDSEQLLGMVWIEGGSFWMGTDELEAYAVERQR
jgi:formylglycine-generating enzyme